MTNLSSVTTKGIAWSAADGWARQLLAFAVFSLLTRTIPPSEFGLVAMATLYISFLQPFVALGLGPAMIRRKTLEHGHYQAAFWASVVMGLVLGAATAVAAPWFARVFNEPRLSTVLAVLALSLPLAAFSVVPTAILTREMQFYPLMRISLISAVAGGVIGVALAVMGCGVWSLVAQQMVTSAAGVILLWKATPYRPTTEFSWAHLRDLRGIAIMVLANATIWFACRRADQVVVGAWIGPAELAVYAAAWKLMTMAVEGVTTPVKKVALSALAAVQHEPIEFDRVFNRLTIGACAIGIPAVVGLGALGTDLVVMLSGSRWSAAGSLLPILVANGVAHVYLVANDAVLTAKNRPRLYVKMLLVQAVASVAASAVGARWGMTGVALATSIGMVLQGGLNIWVLKVKLNVGMGPSARAGVWFLLAALAMGAAVYVAAGHLRNTQPPIAVVVEMVLLGASVYGLLALPVLVGPVSELIWQLARTPGLLPNGSEPVPAAVTLGDLSGSNE